HALVSHARGSRVRGLGTARVSLLEHQIYLAYKVARMANPRVLLSDQVGLGKTIEAGLIFSAMRALGRADRVLIVMPDSLMHQWLIEMLRRFNELFTEAGSDVLNDLISQPAEITDENGNVFSSSSSPFESCGRILMPWSSLQGGLYHEAAKYNWDLLIVDEAHHLRQGMEGYDLIQGLAAKSRGVLLLTGTPSRGGRRTEFDLLHLADSARYPDYQKFLAERSESAAVTEAASRLVELGTSYVPEHEQIFAGLNEFFARRNDDLSGYFDEFRRGREGAYDQLLEALVDRHGPGRVLFRNRRANLGSLFPGRVLHKVPVWKGKIDPMMQMLMEDELKGVYIGSGELDGRLEWLADFLEQYEGDKILLIAHSSKSVMSIRDMLRVEFGIHAAAFYESMTLVERDRQAAWFADPKGPQLMICSEIGSEGRNFQFAHRLVFWDIPVNPDVIEQRIGRLDRIGQKHPVDLYVLYFMGEPSEDLLKWHEAMHSFDGPLEGGEEISKAVHLSENLGQNDFDKVIAESLVLAEEKREQAERNVDVLVDINSYDRKLGAELIGEINEFDEKSGFREVVSDILERMGVLVNDTETPGIFRVKPGDMMKMDHIPGMRNDTALVCFDRATALEREDLEYITADHPLAQNALSWFLDGSEGAATAVRWNHAPKGGFILQALFICEASGHPSLELARCLPPEPMLISLELSGKEFEGTVPAASLTKLAPSAVRAIWGKVGAKIDKLIERAEAMAAERVKPLVSEALKNADRIWKREAERLEQLRRINPNVTKAEADECRKRLAEVREALAGAAPRLDALRMVLLDNR
nr:RNA polymerase-associated protein RapA [bacterium]